MGDVAGQNQNCSGMGAERWLAGETGSHGVHAGVSKDAINYVTRFLLSMGCIHLRNRCSPLNSTLFHSGSCSQLLPRATPAFLPTHYYDKTSPHIPMELCFALRKVSSESKTYDLSLHPYQSIFDFPLGHMNASNRSKK